LHDKKLASECRSRLTQGYTRLDPTLPAEKTRHGLASLVTVSQQSNSLMIDRRETFEAASSFSLLPNVVEKDYVLGWILDGINPPNSLTTTASTRTEFGGKLWKSL
jgi:hypothetical protein